VHQRDSDDAVIDVNFWPEFVDESVGVEVAVAYSDLQPEVSRAS
jgi:hypothetical protein